MPVINDAIVSNNPLLTSSNARPQKLSNGWMITALGNQKTSAISTVGINVDTQMDGTPNFSTSVNIGTDFQRVPIWSTASYGINFYLAFSFSASTTVWVNHYQTSGSNALILRNSYTVDSGQTGVQSLDLIVNQSNGEISLGESTKNSAYPNSFNIRYAKGTIATDGSVAWGAVEQRTTLNTTGNDVKDPSIILVNGKPLIIVSSSNSGSSNAIYALRFNGTSWVSDGVNLGLGLYNNAVYQGGSYTQSSPSTIFVPQSNNGLANGLMGTAWHGRDATHTTTDYIRFSKAVDGIGTTWSAMQKLVPGTNATLTANKSGKLFITYEDSGVTKRIESTNNGDSWSSAVTVGTGTNPSSLFDLTMDMSAPLTIRKGTSSVLFSGSWTVTSISPAPGDIGAINSKNIGPYSITTDGSMSTITEKVNGVTVGTKTATSGQALNVSLTDAQWDAVNFGKYHTATGTPNTLTIEMGTEKWTYTFTKTANESTTESQLVEAVKDMNEVFLPGVKEKLAVPIRSKGGTVPNNPSFDGLADAIAGIQIGKKYASGVANGVFTPQKVLYRGNGTQVTSNYLVTVTGLAFVPKLISIYADNPYETYVNTNNPSLAKIIMAYNTTSQSASVVTYRLQGDAYVNASGFQLPVPGDFLFTWEAYE